MRAASNHACWSALALQEALHFPGYRYVCWMLCTQATSRFRRMPVGREARESSFWRQAAGGLRFRAGASRLDSPAAVKCFRTAAAQVCLAMYHACGLCAVMRCCITASGRFVSVGAANTLTALTTSGYGIYWLGGSVGFVDAQRSGVVSGVESMYGHWDPRSLLI